MIPLLSLMVGVYICTRMLEIIVYYEKQRKEIPTFSAVILSLAAIATIIITVFCVISIMASGVKLPGLE
jgi:ABC-type long-subunit fatty acid transport system fused permease/ATPase subunit